MAIRVARQHQHSIQIAILMFSILKLTKLQNVFTVCLVTYWKPIQNLNTFGYCNRELDLLRNLWHEMYSNLSTNDRVRWDLCCTLPAIWHEIDMDEKQRKELNEWVDGTGRKMWRYLQLIAISWYCNFAPDCKSNLKLFIYFKLELKICREFQFRLWSSWKVSVEFKIAEKGQLKCNWIGIVTELFSRFNKIYII